MSSPQTLHIAEYNIYEDVSSYGKFYPESTVLINYDTPRRVRIPGYEEVDYKPVHKSGISSGSNDDSIRRSKTTVKDIVISNKFDLFCTFTFDPKKVDRYNPDECKKKMSRWLKRQRELHGKFLYIIVPEFHKDGALHFHALFKGYKGNLILFEKSKKKRTVYNIKSYRLGFSTAVKIDNNIEKVGSYVTKYITKEMPTFDGKKRYWCSNNLKRPIVIRNPQLDPWTFKQFVQKYNKNGMTISERIGKLELLHNKEVAEWLTI